MERMNMFGNKKKDKDIAPDIFAKCDSLKTGLSEDFDSKNFSFNNMTHMFDNCTTNNDLNLSQFNTNLLHGATYFRFPECLQEDDYNTYILNIDNHIVIFVVDTDSEECRETALAKLTSEFGVHYAWFKEEKGQKHWVLYNTENYEIKYEDEAYLVAKHAKVLYLPAGITNCYKMFSHLSSFTHLYNLENYSKLEVDMSCAFEGCKDLKLVRMGDAFAVGFFKVNSFAHAFQGCDHLESIDITYVSLKHADFSYAFYGCSGLTSIYVYLEKTPKLGKDIFKECDAKICTVYVPTGTYDDYFVSEFGYFEKIVEFDATGIDKVTTSNDAKELSRYSVNGQRLSAPSKGLNIVKYSDGSVKKVFVQ